MRWLLPLLFGFGCGASVDDEPYVPAVDVAQCAAADSPPVRLWINRVEPGGVDPRAGDGCSDGSSFTIVDLNAQCTLRAATGAALCETPTRVNRARMQLLVQGPTVLPTLNQEFGYVGSEGVTYAANALASSFQVYVPALGPETAAAAIAINANDDSTKYCTPDGVAVAVPEVPSATIRYVGGGAATDHRGFASIEGVPPGRVVDVHITKPGCGSIVTKLRFERGLVSVAGTWLRRM